MEKILVETCDHTLPDVSSAALSGNNYENVDNESESDSGPEIARKTKKTVIHLPSDSESGTAKQQDQICQ